MKILVLDNYDSFTYNLVQYIQEIVGHPVDVFRNDAITLDQVEEYDTIILSPGPSLPSEAGIMTALIKRYAPTKSILGVCLGQQAIGEVFGGSLENLENVFHGLATDIEIIDETEPLFQNLKSTIMVGRYHSWIVAKRDFPESLKITALDSTGSIMALSHKTFNVRGVQFHPESIMTEKGMDILRNFLDYSKGLQHKTAPVETNNKI